MEPEICQFWALFSDVVGNYLLLKHDVALIESRTLKFSWNYFASKRREPSTQWQSIISQENLIFNLKVHYSFHNHIGSYPQLDKSIPLFLSNSFCIICLNIILSPTPRYSKGRCTHIMPCPCCAHAVPLACRPAKGLECVFPIWFTRCGHVWFTLAMPCPCYAPTMPFFSRPRHSTSVERRPVGYLPTFGFFRLPRGVQRRLLSDAYQSQM